MKRFRKSAIALVLAVLMALQGTEPIFVQAKEAIEDVQKNADFSRPEALTEEEAGITDSTSGEQDKSQQSDADVQNETTPSEDTETQEEQTTPAEETEENPQEKEVELKEPQDYYPIPEEPEGELIDYDAISRTYKTGDKQYTTVYGGYVGTYKNEDGDTELVDNTLVKPEEAILRHPKKHRKPAVHRRMTKRKRKRKFIRTRQMIMPSFFRNRCQKRMV